MMAVAMIKKGNSTEPEAIKKTFESTSHYAGISGDLGFSPTKHATITADDLTLVQYDAGTKHWVVQKD